MSAELKPLPSADDREEAVLRLRLGWHSTIYVARPPGREAALRMRERGEVTIADADGMFVIRATSSIGRGVDRGGAA